MMTSPPQDDHPLYAQRKRDEPPPAVVSAAKGRKPRRPPQDRPLLTWLLIAINAVIFAAGMLSGELDRQLFIDGALYPPLVALDGQVYRLFSAMFLHGSIAHLFFNMYALHLVGGTVEPIYGRPRFLLVYFLGGLTGSALSLALGDFMTPALGSSGAVFAIFAAEAAHLYQHRRVYVNVRGRLRHMLILIGINLIIGFMPGSRIDNWGHIGGALGGLLLAWRIAPRIPIPSQPPRSMRDFAKGDVNPLPRQLPSLVIYIFALIGGIALTVNLLASQNVDLISQ